MRQLIVNADDLGLAPGVTRGILELGRLGVVTSVSVLANLPGSADALAAAGDAGLDIGVHLNMVAGAPLLPPGDVPSLLGPDGRFLVAGAAARGLLRGRLRIGEVEREWAAQIEGVLAAGARPSHLDSHCQLHAYPPLYRLALELARRYGIPGVRRAYSGFIYQTPHLFAVRARLRPSRRGDGGPIQTDHFAVLTAMGPWRASRPLQALLRALPLGTTELVCHPGHVDDELRRADPLTGPRERELLLLSRPLFRETLAREGIRLVSWADLDIQRGSGVRANQRKPMAAAKRPVWPLSPRCE